MHLRFNKILSTMVYWTYYYWSKFTYYKTIHIRAPGKHFPGPDFPLLKMGKVNPFDSFYILWGQHFPSYILNKKGKVDL